jgi:hypothetical protein
MRRRIAARRSGARVVLFDGNVDLVGRRRPGGAGDSDGGGEIAGLRVRMRRVRLRVRCRAVTEIPLVGGQARAAFGFRSERDLQRRRPIVGVDVGDDNTVAGLLLCGRRRSARRAAGRRQRRCGNIGRSFQPLAARLDPGPLGSFRASPPGHGCPRSSLRHAASRYRAGNCHSRQAAEALRRSFGLASYPITSALVSLACH